MNWKYIHFLMAMHYQILFVLLNNDSGLFIKVSLCFVGIKLIKHFFIIYFIFFFMDFKLVTVNLSDDLNK